MSNLRKNFIKNLMLVLLIILAIFIQIGVSSEKVSAGISKEVLRLHVVANSDSKEDQEVKYKVRDEIIKYMQTISSDCKTKEEAINVLNESLASVAEISKNVLKENGFNYDVKVEIGNFSFPTKTYGDVALPAGDYDALKVTLGKGEGQNWWCVMFPPLCFVDVSSGIVPEESKEILKDNLDEEEYDVIVVDDNEVNVKFKIVELIGKLKI